MENKVIVLGSIIAVSAVTIALCVMGKKKEEKSNLSGRVDGGAGVEKGCWSKGIKISCP